MTEFLAQNKPNLFNKIKVNITYRIVFIMLCYWLLTNIILLSLIDVINNYWKIIIGFNLGSLASLIGFLILSLSSKWFVSKVALKQTLGYLTFLIRMLIYGLIIILVIFFNFSNLISTIAGFSLLLIAVLTSEFLAVKGFKKEKKRC